MAIRKISKKEEVVYKLLSSHTHGRDYCFQESGFLWDEARYRYASWHRKREVGSFYVSDYELDLCKKEIPELYGELEEFHQASLAFRKARQAFENSRSKFVNKSYTFIKDISKVYRSYKLLTPQEESLCSDYESDPVKMKALTDKIQDLNNQINAIPVGRKFAKQRNPLKEELKKLNFLLSIIKG